VSGFNDDLSRAMRELEAETGLTGRVGETVEVRPATDDEQREALERELGRDVTVCAECLRASCWHGEFMCERSRDANVRTLTVRQLRSLNLEHPDNYSRERVAEVHGSEPE